MKVDAKVRRLFRLQSTVFLTLLLTAAILLAWLSQLYSVRIDLSKNARNSLSEESQRLVRALDQPLQITLFVSPNNDNHTGLKNLFQRYADLQPLIEFKSLNPDLHPELLNQHRIRFDGESLIEFAGRKEKVSRATEANITNAIQRLMRQGERWLVFLQAHGERNPYSEANHDYSLFTQKLLDLGYHIENLNLTKTNSIPDNTDVLVLASPRVPLLEGEIDLLQAYIEQGGNLLWLADPEQTIEGLESLSATLGIHFLPGILVDPNSQLLGLDRVDFALVTEYPQHPVTENIQNVVALFPRAQALEYRGDADVWQALDFLMSAESSWNETGIMKGKIHFSDQHDELRGPLKIGVTLSAKRAASTGDSITQRVAVIGDADFISNQYLGNGANLDIGMNLINWLSHDDRLISISPRPAPDTRLELSQTAQLLIGIGFLFVLPLLLFGSGLVIWVSRRRR